MKNRGFTLVECLVSVTIIAVLMSCTYAIVSRAVAHARIVESSNNLRQLVIANQTYETENGYYCPADNQSNTLRWHGRRTSSKGKFNPAKGLLSPYLGGSQSVNVCPLFKALVSDSKSFEAGTGGYGYNAAYIGGKPGSPWDSTTKLRDSALAAQVDDPANTVMFTTTAYARSDGLQEYPYCEPPFWDFGDGPSGNRPSPSVHFRANGKAIVAWCDGHVTLESNNRSEQHGNNPHGGDSHDHDLGWFGKEENNGAWNSRHR
jgi:prepilin-type N-terminal cleavage/methylation domain-containing protein/prepilin-type processing-associated H-X9-DG protein